MDKVVVKPDGIVIRGPKEPIMAVAKSGNLPGNQVPIFAREWRAPPGDDDNYVYAIAL